MKPGFFGFSSPSPLQGPIDCTLRTEHLCFGVGFDAFEHGAGTKVFVPSDTEIVGLNGAWLNAPTMDALHAHDSVKQAVESPQAFGRQRGPLQGICVETQSGNLLLHTDSAGHRPFFVFSNQDTHLFASSLERLVGLMRLNGHLPQPDSVAGAALLAFGSIPGEKTLLLNVRKTRAGSTIIIGPQGLKETLHTDYSVPKRSEISGHEAIERLQKNFEKAVKMMVQFNQVHAFNQYNLLSGGIDSRMVLLETIKHAKDVHTICFSKAGYWDQTISEQIARDLGTNHEHYDLGTGQYLMRTDTIDDYDGTVNYLASAHHRRVLDALKPDRMGLLGGGPLGNEIMGEFLKAGHRPDRVIRSLLTAPQFYEYCQSYLQDVWAQTPDPVVFKLHQRAFLFTNSAAFSTLHKGFLYSPFSDPDFLNTALSLPEHFLKGQNLYLKWMGAKYPEGQRYLWERYRAKPIWGPRLAMAKWRMKLLTKFVYPRSKFRNASMNPLDFWHDHSPELQRFFRERFEQNKHMLALFPELRSMVETEYDCMSVFNKASVLTLLMTADKFFNARTE